MQEAWTPLSWGSQNLTQLVGWIALGGFAWRWSNKISGYGQKIDLAIADVSTIMTNHLPHLQTGVHDLNKGLGTVNENITGLREDMRDGLNRMGEDVRLVLSGMIR